MLSIVASANYGGTAICRLRQTKPAPHLNIEKAMLAGEAAAGANM